MALASGPMALSSKGQELALAMKAALTSPSNARKIIIVNKSYNKNKLIIIYVKLIINEHLSKKQSKVSSLIILSGCQTYCVS